MMAADTLLALVDGEGVAVRVLVTDVDGSAPRRTGAVMLVAPTRTTGSIGGGALEHQAIGVARRLLAGEPQPWQRHETTVPLGPALGQCCGGSVRLLFEVFRAGEARVLPSAGARGLFAARPIASGQPLLLVADRRRAPDAPVPVVRVLRQMTSGERPKQVLRIAGRGGALAWVIEPWQAAEKPLYLYGAGHVGRAIVRVLEELPFAIRWVDVAVDRFPATVRPGVEIIVASDAASIAAMAEADAVHLVMTYAHPLDLAICAAVLRRNEFDYLGLIGSRTKRVRFERRLAAAGIEPARIDRVVSPIGLPGLAGKEPATIAIAVAAELLLWHQRRQTAVTEHQQGARA